MRNNRKNHHPATVETIGGAPTSRKRRISGASGPSPQIVLFLRMTPRAKIRPHLARLLKRLLRDHGMRCVSIQQTQGETTTVTKRTKPPT
jgi:hypothetical protein